MDDAELSDMAEEMMEAYETVVTEGLTEEEMMTAGMELYMGISSHIMGKIAEPLGVEQWPYWVSEDQPPSRFWQ